MVWERWNIEFAVQTPRKRVYVYLGISKDAQSLKTGSGGDVCVKRWE